MNRLINLLALTDGRDKIYKFLAGLFKILGAISGSSEQKALAASCTSVGSAIGSARSIMRMGRFVADVPKLEKLSSKVAKKAEIKTVIEILRTIGNSLYIIGDNIAFVAKHKLIAVSDKEVTKYAKTAQFWGFFLASVLDLFALTAAFQKSNSDPAASKKETRSALIGLAKDGSDTLVSLAAVGYVKSIWQPSAITTGALTCVSGGVATYNNWKKA